MLMGLYIKMVLMVVKEQSMTSCHLLEPVDKLQDRNTARLKQLVADKRIITYLRLWECTIGGALRKYDIYISWGVWIL